MKIEWEVFPDPEETVKFLTNVYKTCEHCGHQNTEDYSREWRTGYVIEFHLTRDGKYVTVEYGDFDRDNIEFEQLQEWNKE